MSDVLRQEIFEFLSNYHFGVIATVSDAKPEAAIVGFKVSNDLTMLIGTSIKTRKFANIQSNPHIAIAIGDVKGEVQYEGTVTQHKPNESWEEVEARFGKLPGFEKYRNDPDEIWLLVKPSWLRLTMHESPNRIEEVSFS
jgi:general stress protein 26